MSCQKKQSLNNGPARVAFVAWSGVGKTTLIESVIGILTGRGYRIGAVKHNSHHLDIDHPGKDSARFTAAGAENMALVSDETVALVMKPQKPVKLEDIIDKWFGEMDLVLVEGFKLETLPKIEIFRTDQEKPMLSQDKIFDQNVLAVASNTNLDIGIPLLDLDKPEEVADFLEKTFLKNGPLDLSSQPGKN
jgi:molybdopterin-guanine dinucleotide biosynthesis protein MobB